MSVEYVGVFKRKTKNGYKYVPQIYFENYQIKLGIFDNPKDAAIRYDYFALLIHGRGAKLNFPIIDTCEVEDCDEKPYKFNKSNQMWMCKPHHNLFNNNIFNGIKQSKYRNTYVYQLDYTLLEIYNAVGNKIKTLKISNEDVEKVSKIKWYVIPNGRPVGNYKFEGKYRTVNLGKYIINNGYLNKRDGLSVHFKNGDNTDFRRENLLLRHTTQKISQDERCKDITGMWYDIHNNKYVVEKTIKGTKYCKRFKQFKDAIGYLNYILMKHNLPVIITTVKEDII